VTPNQSAVFCVLLCGGFVIGGCATPVAPMGGPPDTTPPRLVSSVPEQNSVNFASDRITLTFSEKVDRATLQRSLSFTPEIVLAPEFRWHGESVDLVFRGPLRDSTTYILLLDNEFRDNRGVAITRPITLAFSTGPTIDEGRIAGKVANPSNGGPVQRVDIFAYDGAVTPAEVPSYRTQTDSDGSFAFANLPMRRFLVVAVEDRNRNRLIDSTEAVALPSWGTQIPDTGASAHPTPTWFMGRTDIRPPTVIQLLSLSSRRTVVRFSEPVSFDWQTPEQWMLADTLTARLFAVSQLYQPLGASNRIILVTDSLHDGEFEIQAAGVVRDSAGYAADVAGVGSFSSSSRRDTLRIRFDGFGSPDLDARSTIDLGSGIRAEIRFNRFVDELRLGEMVSARDSKGNVRAAEFLSADGTTWTLTFRPKAAPGDSITVEVSGVTPPDTVYSAVFAYLGTADTGSISGAFNDSADVVVQISATAAPRVKYETASDFTGAFRFGGLLKGNYRLRAFEDLNGDGRWTPGRLEPRRLPEPLLWYENFVEVRKGWESEVDTLRFVVP